MPNATAQRSTGRGGEITPNAVQQQCSTAPAKKEVTPNTTAQHKHRRILSIGGRGGSGRETGDCWGQFQRCRGWLLVITTLVGGAEGSDAVW